MLVGTALSLAPGDVKVKVTVGGATSPEYPITVRGPKTLIPGQPEDLPNSTYGYLSTIPYTIRDNLNANMPSALGVNENWTTIVYEDLPGNNWVREAPNGVTAYNSAFVDQIGGMLISYPAIPTPSPPCGPPRCTQKIDHWGQEFRVGSTNPGAGARVQTKALQSYIDHGRHEGIVSPAP
jgi:hypothetical protein